MRYEKEAVMKGPIYKWALLSIAMGAFLPEHADAATEWRPAKNVEIVAGAGPASSFDRTARAVQRALRDGKLVDVPVAVINRPGGGGAIAWNYLNTHSGDGSYLAVIVPGVLTNRITGSNQLSHKDLSPLAMLYSEYVLLAVNITSPIKSGSEFIAALRKDPASLSIGVATALGGANHLAAVLALKNAGVDIKKTKFVVFPSAPESVTAVAGNHIDAVSASPGNVLPQASRLRLLAVTAPKRLEGALQEVPTWKEQGVNAVFDSWRGIVGPKGLTRDQVAYWDAIFKRITEDPEWRREATRNYVVNSYMNSSETDIYLDQQYKELEELLGALGLVKY